MADITNLENFLTDVAGAIKQKTGKEEKIPAADFDTEILNIETGIDTSSDNPITADSVEQGKEGFVNGEKVVGTLPSTSSSSWEYIGNYAEGKIQGISSTSPDTGTTYLLKFKATTSNKTIYEAGSEIGIACDESEIAKYLNLTPEKLVKGNKILEVEGTAEIGEEINNQDKDITKNGIYTADEGYTGLGTVNVEVLQENKLTPAEYETALQLCNDIKGNPAPKEGHIYGVRKPLNGFTLERTDDARGLVAEATHNGHPEEATNNFDDLYPWSDIKSFMYDNQKEEIIAWFGDNEFTFTPEETYINIFTRIPRFWYKRYKDEEYEYWKIADYAAEGFIEFKGSSPARYNMSGSISAPRSVSNKTPLAPISLNNSRKYALNLSSYTGLLDIWSFGAIQMLYLVEYANADSQSVLGNGATSARRTINTTGSCDSLGMKSGCITNNNYLSSIIYRGFEDIYGNVNDVIDGINVVNYEPWVCTDWKKYSSTNTADYTKLTYKLPHTSNKYGTVLGLDTNNPLVMMPISFTSDQATSFTKDTMWITNTNNLIVSTGYGADVYLGLFNYNMERDADSTMDTYQGARFLLHKIS